MAEAKKLKLRAQIEAVCKAFDLEPKIVSYIGISPFAVTVYYYDSPPVQGEDDQPVEHAKTLPYEWTTDDGSEG